MPTKTIDPSPPQPTTRYEMKYSIVFNLGWTIDQPYTQEEFIRCAREHMEFMAKEIEAKFPRELAQALHKDHLLAPEFVKALQGQNGKGGKG